MLVKKLHAQAKNTNRYKILLMVCLFACNKLWSMQADHLLQRISNGPLTNATVEQVESFLESNKLEEPNFLNTMLLYLAQNYKGDNALALQIAKKLKDRGADPRARVTFTQVFANGKSAHYATSVVESYSTPLDQATGDLKIFLSGLSAKY